MPLIETLEGWSFRVFGKAAPFFLKRIYQFKTPLEKGRVKIYPETYVSLMLFAALLTVPVSVIGGALFLLYGLLPLLILVPMPLFVLVGFMVIPLSKASDRASNLEREMPFAAAYISVMASGGIAPYTSFKRLSEVELMPAMRGEAREIMKDVEIFGIDPLSALEGAAKKTPLDIFKDFLGGYASTVIIGGDIGHFLERKAEDIFKTRALRVKAAAERLGMLLETFIIVMVMMSLCFYILFAVDRINGGGGGDASVYTGIIMYTYLFTPMLSMLFVYLAHSMQPKTPVVEMRPYKIFGVCSILGVVLFLLLTNFVGMVQLPLFTQLQAMGLDMPVAVAVSLFVATAPAAFVHVKMSKKKNSMEQGVNSFLRDLTEIRKTGLSPEKCIESLSKRDYGAFSKELRKISAEISWGIPVKKVMMDFLKRTRSWMVQIVMFLLVETIDVGGGTIAMIESLSRFNNLTQEVEKEKKMSVRPYVMMPYLASILLVATTIMMMSFTTGFGAGTMSAATGAAAAPSQDLGMMQTIFMTSVIFHSYLIGIVAGKISDESIASGFKHASILVIIAVIAAKVIPQFVNF
ncbi:MAG: type II secretion system F family protein [Candidatus Bathyarchaeota archaeon]|nr:type II secretion system F family protein [Candidatus Bathyarchaeota archaeon]